MKQACLVLGGQAGLLTQRLTTLWAVASFALPLYHSYISKSIDQASRNVILTANSSVGYFI